MEEKLQWVFGLYDLDGDGLISKEEMLDVVGSIYEMLGRYTQPQILEPHVAAREHVDRIFHVSINITSLCMMSKKVSELKIITNKIKYVSVKQEFLSKIFITEFCFKSSRLSKLYNLSFILKIKI